MSINYLENNNIGFLELDQADSKVNLLTAEMLKRFDAELEQVRGKSHLKALVISSKKKDVFIAGADIKEIEQITDPLEGQQKSQQGQEILNKIEDLGIPTIAVIDGITLGGGCELALACQYRLATFNERIKIGLPEVNLGIIPGFGGTYRLPRLIGIAEGLKMILSGKPVDSVKALRLGLVDRLVPTKGLEESLNNFIRDVLAKKISANKYTRRRVKGLPACLEQSSIGQRIIFRQSRASVMEASKGFYPAPLKAIDVIQKTFYINDRRQGLELEAKTFSELAITETSKNLVHIFYLSEKYRKLMPEGTEKIPVKRIEKCGIAGAGVMGGGIAQLLSDRDIWVRLKDINYQALALGLKSADKLYKQSVKKRRIKPYEAVVKMDRITPTLDYSGFRTADFVIEAVVENMDIKRRVFYDLSENTSSNCILATNTSALSVTEMANQTKDPSKVIGLHFFNPVHRMPLVEIITTSKTSLETLASTLSLVKQLGKTPIIVKDSCGFLVNRILLGYINEAGRIFDEGGKISDIDKVMTDFGMPMGPFALSDEVGLDVGIKVLHILADGLGERFKPIETFEKVFSKGLLGKKSSKGFYIHTGKRIQNPEIRNLSNKTSESIQLNNDECLQRMIYLMINEAARCLDEKIVDNSGAVDVGMIFGTGFPAFRGGLLRTADKIGVSKIVDRLNWMKDKFHAERFAPSAFLIKLQKENKGFYNK